MKVHVLHENPDWYAPLGAAFDAAGVPHEQWLLGDGVLDLTGPPPDGVFWSRMSASSHTRGHPYAKDLTRGVLCWLEAHGRVVVNGRRVLELEMSKVDQLTALAAAGFDVPRHDRGGRPGRAGRAPPRSCPPRSSPSTTRAARAWACGCGPATRSSTAHLAGPDYEAPVDGITLVQEYLRAAAPFITRAEFVGGEFLLRDHRGHRPRRVRAVPGRRVRGRPACPAGRVDAARSLFALRDGFDHPVIGRYREFAAAHGIGIAGFEFIETADGRAGHLRREHHDQLQRRHRGRGPAARAARGGPLPRRPAGPGGSRTRQRKPERPGPGHGEEFADAFRVLDADLRRLAAQRRRREMPVAWPYLRDLAVASESRVQPEPDRRAEPERHQGPPGAVAGLLDAGPGHRRGDPARSS